MDKQAKQEKREKITVRPVRARRDAMRRWSSVEKSRAVLSIWTERRKPTEVCQEMEISWGILNHWEKRALEGMLCALEAHTKRDQKGPAVGKRVQALLEQRELAGSGTTADRLEERLAKLQETRSQENT